LRHQMRSSLDKIQKLESENEALKRQLLAMKFGSSMSQNQVDDTTTSTTTAGTSFPFTRPLTTKSSSSLNHPHCTFSHPEDIEMNRKHSFKF
jgi:hypothetical protein